MRSTVVCALLLSCSSVDAAPTLLAEITHDVAPIFQDHRNPVLPTTLPYSFQSSVDAGPSGNWIQTIMWADIGQTFVAGPDVIAPIAAVLANPEARFGLNFGTLQTHVDFSVSDSGQHPPLANYNLLVPTLQNYRISRLERTIRDFILEWVPDAVGRAYNYGGAQTIRIYGEVVPEPATLLLTMIHGIGLSFLTCRSRTCW